MRGYNRRPAENKPFDKKNEDNPLVVYFLLGVLAFILICAFI